MLMEHAMMGATRENYEDLMWAVIYQACLDYDKHPEKIFDKERRADAESAKWFLEDPNNPYFAYLDVNGQDLIKQMHKNLTTYGKYVLSPTDLDELKEYGRILSPEERKLVKKQKKKKGVKK